VNLAQVTPCRPTAGRHGTAVLALRVAAVLGLAVDVYVHLRLAPLYDQLGTQITQGTLFRIEAALATAAAGYLALRDSRQAWLSAAVVAASGTLAVLLTRYVDVPALGPLPDMYDPQWSSDKVLVTLAMLVTFLAVAIREALRAPGNESANESSLRSQEPTPYPRRYSGSAHP
jgi:hypothetical protein